MMHEYHLQQPVLTELIKSPLEKQITVKYLICNLFIRNEII